MAEARAAISRTSRETDLPAEYPEGWYALAPIEQLTADEPVGVDFLNGRVVMFRDAEGSPVVLGAYCCHLGADLAVGVMVDGHVQCAFHHWEFDGSGACVKIPITDQIPANARQYSYPVHEEMGLVWVFNGETPTEPPFFRNFEDQSFVYQVSEPLDLPLEPAGIVSNAIDLQHIETLHGMTISGTPEVAYHPSRVEFDVKAELPNIGMVSQHSTIFGTSTLTMTGGAMGIEIFVVAAGTPIGNSSRFWFVAGAPAELGDLQRRSRLMVGMQSIREFVEQDEPVLRTMHLRRGVLIDADRVLNRFLKYVEAYPRSNPGAKWLR